MAVLYLLDGGSLLRQREVETVRPDHTAAETPDAAPRVRDVTTQTRLPLGEDVEPSRAGRSGLEGDATPRRFRAHRPKTSRASTGQDDGHATTDH
jgi:hypothetical protein